MKEIRKLKRVVVKEELVALTKDMESAIILNQFIYWSERIKDFDKFIYEENERRKRGNLPDSSMELQNGWIYKDLDELKDELMFTCSTKTISRKITALIEKGWLDRRNNPNFKWDRTYQYRVNLINIIKDLHKLGYVLQDYKIDLQAFISCNGQNDDCNGQNGDCNGQNDVPNGQDDDAIPKITTETTTEITTINQSIENENKKENIHKNDIERLIDIDNKFKAIGYKTYDKIINELQLKDTLKEYPYDRWLVTVEKAIWEMYYYDETKIKNRLVNQYDIVTKLQDLNWNMVIDAVGKANESSQYEKIKYPIAFMKTTLFNEIDEHLARIHARVNYDLSENLREKTPSGNNYKNGFHNFEGSSKKYTEDEVERIAKKKREEYFKERDNKDVASKSNNSSSAQDKTELDLIERFKNTEYENAFTGIINEITPAAYDAFFKNAIVGIEGENNNVVLKIKGDSLVKNILENKYIKLIENHFSKIGVENVLLENV